MLKGKKRVEETSESEELSSEEEEHSWIAWFCSLKGNEFYCEVDEEYIQDDFNLTGLRSIVPNYDYALDLVLDSETDGLTDEQQEIVESAAELLYGLVHARFVLTARGMNAMLEKYKRMDFGRCPRVLCGGQPVLPCGQSDQPRMNTVKIYCPKCEDIYYPRLRRHSNIDGAYFGTTFCHLLVQSHPHLRPPKATEHYVPRIYGFKIHPSARAIEEKERELYLARNAQRIAQNKAGAANGPVGHQPGIQNGQRPLGRR